MRKLASFVCMLLPLATLAGCSNISRLDVPPDAPSPEGKYRPSVESIVQRVRCELRPLADKTRDINLTQGDWVAVVQLSLDVIDDGSLAPSFNYINGLFSFNVGAKYEVSREHNVVIDLIYPIKEIESELEIERLGRARGHLGAAGPSRFSCPDVGDTNLAGELSITESADMAYKAENLNTTVGATANGGVFGGYV